MDYIACGKKVFDIELEALQKTREALDDTFLKILNEIVLCKGKVVLTGMGKSGHVAKKISATMASLGTSSVFLHPGEALHGDLGIIDPRDIVIAISYSGESDEIINIIPNIRMIGSKLICICGNIKSTLAKNSDIVQVLPKFEEACHLGLAPTSSTTVILAYGDALAVTASIQMGFSKENFGLYHPAGALGKKIILKVSDLMAKREHFDVLHGRSCLKDVIVELCRNTLGMAAIVNEDFTVAGIITDGDVRRILMKREDIFILRADELMSIKPVVVQDSMMAVTALDILKKNNISCAPAVDGEGLLTGIINLRHILAAGILS